MRSFVYRVSLSGFDNAATSSRDDIRRISEVSIKGHFLLTFGAGAVRYKNIYSSN